MHIEPGDNVMNLGHMMARPYSNAVRLIRYPHQNTFNAQELQRLVVLFGIGHWGPVVGFSSQNHGRRLDVLHHREERAVLVMLDMVPRQPGEPVLADEVANIGSEHKTVPIDDRIYGNGGAKP